MTNKGIPSIQYGRSGFFFQFDFSLCTVKTSKEQSSKAGSFYEKN